MKLLWIRDIFSIIIIIIIGTHTHTHMFERSETHNYYIYMACDFVTVSFPWKHTPCRKTVGKTPIQGLINVGQNKACFLTETLHTPVTFSCRDSDLLHHVHRRTSMDFTFPDRKGYISRNGLVNNIEYTVSK